MLLADATQSEPYVLYISSQQKLEFEFEKNLKNYVDNLHSPEVLQLYFYIFMAF